MKLIDADKLHYKKVWIENEDYDVKAAVVVFAKEIDKAPIVEAIPVEWIRKYEKYDDLAASIYLMLEAWGVDMSDEGETV